ncbi:hypothetical protein Pan216_50350 [Planctomycetes bacterium Pan216]|uniref:DUF1570 domain-containing protein n=2 Tax=Kolteria novifilia TaxID=2527975 RepID=A0A518BAY8_9BACT|nr:hypothetical protein Pan216_50350 [Planctomycetes bacterium Pan216]
MQGPCRSRDCLKSRLWLCLAFALVALPAAHADVITTLADNKKESIEGTVLFEDTRGHLVFEGRDGQYHFLDRKEIVDHQRSRSKVRPYTSRQLQAALAKQLGPNFKFLKTKNYLVCHSCSHEFAREAANLFELAYAAFHNHFRRHGGFRLTRPSGPLVAVVCGSRSEYVKLLYEDKGLPPSSSVGVYRPGPNRMYMYDSRGSNVAAGLRSVRKDSSRSDQVRPALLDRDVETIIHEAVHQVAFNTGLHKRSVVGNPVWLVEGLAMYFETAAHKAGGGTRGTSDINPTQLEQFSRMYPDRVIPLAELVVDDERFRKGDKVSDSYTQAWAFTYFLIKSKPRASANYMKILYDRDPFVAYTPEERLADFREAFGKPPEKLELEFRRFISRVVRR